MGLLGDLLVFCCERLSWVLEKNRQNSDHCTKTAVLISVEKDRYLILLLASRQYSHYYIF